jgi:aspartyl-tRNA(Asn)/glutamyl-tRNA(Gln) amidotransferase subunit C
MAAVEIDVKYVAHLARLSLSPEEEQKISEQLGNILGYIEKLKEDRPRLSARQCDSAR